MENDYCPKDKILTASRDEIKKYDNSFKSSLENSEDLFIDVSPIPCIMGSKLILNDRYMGNRSK